MIRVPFIFIILISAINVAKAEIVAHPSGCPHYLFCGCGTALYLLGSAVTRGGLAIAANWLRLPETTCATRMAAARRGHVFAIINCLPGNRALAYDPNSGGGKTRIHIVSLARYKIVNPHVGYVSKLKTKNRTKQQIVNSPLDHAAL